MYWKLLLTIIIELPILFLFYPKQNWKNILFLAAIVSCVTWPIGMYIFRNTEISIYWIELMIAAVEIAMILAARWGSAVRAALAGLCMNALSFGVGILWNVVN